VPRVVIGGISILLYGALCVHAIRRLVEARVDAAGPRALMVVAFMLVLGVGGAQFAAGPVALSGVALALAAGVLLNLALRRRKAMQKAPPAPPAGHS
jgi:uracil permease